MHRFWRYENNVITLFPVDESQPRLGGKVRVRAFIFDLRTFTPQLKYLYGVYGDDFITFGEYKKDAGEPFEDEALLIKIADENAQDRDQIIGDRTTFRFVNNQLTYEREVNENLKDVEIEHEVKES